MFTTAKEPSGITLDDVAIEADRNYSTNASQEVLSSPMGQGILNGDIFTETNLDTLISPPLKQVIAIPAEFYVDLCAYS